MANDDFVYFVGRIGPRKNQLNLVRASNKENVRLIIIGGPSPNDIRYYEIVRKEYGKNIYFTDHIAKEYVLWFLKHAKGHI